MTKTKSDVCEKCGQQYEYMIGFDEYQPEMFDVFRECECGNEYVSVWQHELRGTQTLKQIFDENYRC